MQEPDAAAAEIGVSGVYSWELPVHGDGSGEPLAARVKRDELRLNVDGTNPTPNASGTSYVGVMQRFHWIASPHRPRSWSLTGAIWYTDGNLPFPYRTVEIEVAVALPIARTAIVTFSGDVAPMVRVYRWESAASHPAEFEFDASPDANPVVAIGTHDHPNRPRGLPRETLAVEEVYRCAGFAVTKSGGEGGIPCPGLAGTVPGAMPKCTTRCSGSGRGSRMLPNGRCGCCGLHSTTRERASAASCSTTSAPTIGRDRDIHRVLVAHPPPGDAAPEAWVLRMRFWTGAHEMGHAFNLAHA